MAHALIVGGGILGTYHALEALRRGHTVEHFDAEAEPHDATVRSPGALSPSWAADGLDLELSLRARTEWAALAGDLPDLHLRPAGSLVVAADPSELELLELAMAHRSAEARHWRLLDPAAVRGLNPALAGDIAGALHSELDAVMEPRTMLAALRAHLHRSGDAYRFVAGRAVTDFGADFVTDATGRVHRGDLVVLCLGTRAELTASLFTSPGPVHRLRLQLLQSEPLGRPFPTLVADVHSLARHGVLGEAEIQRLAPSDPLLGEFDVRFVAVQRATGALTIGEAREAQEPFAFDLAERPAKVLLGRLEQFLGRPAPSVVRRWSAVLHECTDGRLWLREDLDDTVALVTGADQRGITLAPVIAADTFDWLEEGVDSGGSRPGVTRRS